MIRVLSDVCSQIDHSCIGDLRRNNLCRQIAPTVAVVEDRPIGRDDDVR